MVEPKNNKPLNIYSIMLGIIILMLGGFGSISLVYMSRLEHIYELANTLCMRISAIEEKNTHQESRLDQQRSAINRLDDKTDELRKYHIKINP